MYLSLETIYYYTKHFHLWNFRYRLRAIISRGLYIFYPIFKDHFFVFKEVFSENSVLMYGLYSRAASNDGALTVFHIIGQIVSRSFFMWFHTWTKEFITFVHLLNTVPKKVLNNGQKWTNCIGAINFRAEQWVIIFTDFYQHMFFVL